MTSFCVVCDAEPGQCGHEGARYLPDIVYEPADAGGWKVPDHERERWNQAPLRPDRVAPVAEEPRDIGIVLGELEPFVYVDDLLERQIRQAHNHQPLRVTRLVTYVIEEAAKGSLHSPRAFLYTRLAEIER